MGMLVIAAVLILPGPLLTVWNVWTLIFKKKHSGKVEAAAFALGIVYMALLYGLWQPRPWEESIVKPSDMSSLHEPLSREYILTVLVLFVVGIVSYAFLKMREEKAAPLAKVLAMAGVYLGIAVNLLFIIQLFGITADNEIFMNALPFDVLLMMLVPFNYIILAVNQLLRTVREQSRRLAAEERGELSEEESDMEPYKNRFLNDCSRILAKSCSWALYALLLTLPLCLCVIKKQ